MRLMKPNAMIREARSKLCLTQSAAGRLFGATLRTWQDWEGGKRKPHGSATRLIRLATEMPEVVEWLRARQGDE
jgi:putative transcriptional regulator